MVVRFILTDYVSQALAHAVYGKLEDGTFAGRIPPCAGVVAFGTTLNECEAELRSTLEDWMLVSLNLLFLSQTTDYVFGSAYPGDNGNGLKGAVEGTSPAFHTGIPVNYGCLTVLDDKYAMGADFSTNAAPCAPLHIQIYGDYPP